MEILYRIARASLNSCLFRLKPASLNGSAVSQFEAPSSWHISIFFLSISVRSSLSRMDFSCSFCFNYLSFAMDFFISFILFSSILPNLS